MAEDKYTYEIGNSLYINLTNKCSNNCDFCVRNNSDGVDGYYLWLKKEPTAQEVIDEMPDPTKYKEIVFCGYGEPMYKLDEILAIATYVKEKGGSTRINTNGQANLIHGKDVTPSLAGKIDVLSISLNESNAKDYQAICHSQFGERAFGAVLDFAKESAKVVPKVVLSVVDILPQEKIEKCQRLAENTGVALKVRKYIE
jgi:TatD family-associated radical SAM protein